jgi:hypothetical protein
VQSSFSTEFQFQITQPGADGFTFAIQNSSAGTSAIGDGSFGGSGLGYQNIPDSLVVEFDTYGECNGNQISVHTRGTAPNTADEAASIGSVCALPNMKDGNIHNVRIAYASGSMNIFLDDANTPALTVPVDLASTLSLDNSGALLDLQLAPESLLKITTY